MIGNYGQCKVKQWSIVIDKHFTYFLQIKGVQSN